MEANQSSERLRHDLASLTVKTFAAGSTSYGSANCALDSCTTEKNNGHLVQRYQLSLFVYIQSLQQQLLCLLTYAMVLVIGVSITYVGHDGECLCCQTTIR
jgi:hypothetical protein